MGIFPEIMTTTPRYDGSESKTMVCTSPGYYWITARGMDPVGVRRMQQAGMCLACGWTGCSGRSWGWTTSYTPGRTGTHPFGPLPSRRPWGIMYHLSLSLSRSFPHFIALSFFLLLCLHVHVHAEWMLLGPDLWESHIAKASQPNAGGISAAAYLLLPRLPCLRGRHQSFG